MSDLECVVQQDIYKIIDELKRCTSTNIYYDLVAKLYYLNELISLKQLHIKYPNEYWFEYFKKDTDPKKLDFEKSVFYDAINNYKFNYKLAKMSDKLMERYVNDSDYVTLRYVPFDMSLNLANKFFSTFDEDVYAHFLEVVNSPRFVLVNKVDNYEGWALRNNYLVDSYTVIVPYCFITDYLSIVHEIMHSYNFKLIKNCSIKEQDKMTLNALYEIPSFFIEHVALDYLNTINYNVDEIVKLKSLFDKELIYMLANYKQILLDEYVEFGDYLYKETYSYGRVLSYHFYNNYLKDADKTIKELKQFMFDYKTFDRDYMLSHYGLNKSSIINPQKLTKYMDKHLMRL